MEKLISQKDIDELLEHISDEELIDFAKSYLRTNPEMYSALKDKYMLCSEHDSESFCYKKEVDACYRFILKTPQWEYRRRYEPDYLDWEKVGNSLLRVIKRAEKCIANGDPDTAINTALYILKSNDRKFEEEYLHEREDWNPKDMHLEECIFLIESAFNSPLISKQRKLFVCDELENCYDSYIFEYIDDSCVQELITEVRESLLTDDEQLDIIKRKLQNESSEWGKEEYALEIWYFLKEKGRVDEAIAFFQEHKRNNRIRQEYVNILISTGKKQEALAAIDEGIEIARKHSYRHIISEWRLCKMSLYESMKDNSSVLAVCRELFREADDSEVLKHYHKIKNQIPTGEWPAYRDELLKTRDFGSNANNSLAEIYVEEHLFDRLYDHLLHSDFALLSALESYAKYFPHEQQKELVARLEKELCHEFSMGANRSTYQNLAGRISRLKNTCPSGKDMAEKIINYYLTRYRNRPALREELLLV